MFYLSLHTLRERFHSDRQGTVIIRQRAALEELTVDATVCPSRNTSAAVPK